MEWPGLKWYIVLLTTSIVGLAAIIGVKQSMVEIVTIRTDHESDQDVRCSLNESLDQLPISIYRRMIWAVNVCIVDVC